MCVVTFDWEENDAIEKVKKFMKERRLVWAVIELTTACNFNCIWCYANSGYERNTAIHHMKFSDLQKILRILAEAGVRQVTFSGGEPTLYPRLKDAVSLASEMGFIVHINTNGYALTGELARELARRGLSQVQINIDSLDPEKHDRIRGKKGSFKRAVEALKNAREAGITCVSQTVLIKDNEDEIFDIFRFARFEVGVHRCRVWDMVPVEGVALQNFQLKPTDYVKILRALAIWGEEMGVRHIESGDPFFPGDFKCNIPISGGFCAAMAGGFFTIGVDGSAYACATQRKPLYNILEVETGAELNEIHRSGLEREYMQEIRKLPCTTCSRFELCKGGCPTRREYSDTGVDYWCSEIKSVQELQERV